MGTAEPEKPAEPEKKAESESKKDGGQEEEEEEIREPIEDPHEGKPLEIEDAEGRTRYLCLDGQYRRGDPDAIEMKPANFKAWLSEWVVAARSGQLQGKPRKTFLIKHNKLHADMKGNPTGNSPTAGEVMRSEEVLTQTESDPNKPP